MDNANLLVTLVLVLILGGVLAYFIIDYMSFKKTTGQDLTTEQTDRQTSLQTVVSQVNSTNSNIYTNIATVNTTQTQLLTGMSNLFNLTSNMPLSSNTYATSPVSLLNFPGQGNVNMNLHQHVNASSGITASGLTSANQVQMCSASDPGRCIQLPNSNGDLYFTPMASTSKSSIIMDAPMTTVTGSLNIGDMNTGTLLGSDPSGSGALLQSNRNILIRSGSTNGMAVTPVGVEIIGNNNVPVATITPTGSNIVVNTPNMIITGNLNVQGTITSMSGPVSAASTQPATSTATAMGMTAASQQPATSTATAATQQLSSATAAGMSAATQQLSSATAAGMSAATQQLSSATQQPMAIIGYGWTPSVQSSYNPQGWPTTIPTSPQMPVMGSNQQCTVM